MKARIILRLHAIAITLGKINCEDVDINIEELEDTLTQQILALETTIEQNPKLNERYATERLDLLDIYHEETDAQTNSAIKKWTQKLSTNTGTQS